jgi:hypothetical protein
MRKPEEEMRNKRKMTKQTKISDFFRLFRYFSFFPYSLLDIDEMPAHKIRQARQFLVFSFGFQRYN